MAGRRNRKKQSDEKEEKEKDTNVLMAHHIYFYSPGLVQKPCYNTSIYPHYHNDRIYVQFGRNDIKYMCKVYKGYPKCQTYFQIHETWIHVNWTLNDRKADRGFSLRFYQRPCHCARKCCRGKNKHEIKFPEIKRVLKFDDRALYYKVDPIDPEKGTVYHCPPDVYQFQKKAFDYELYENTKSLIIQEIRYKPQLNLRNSIGNRINVSYDDIHAFDDK